MKPICNEMNARLVFMLIFLMSVLVPDYARGRSLQNTAVPSDPDAIRVEGRLSLADAMTLSLKHNKKLQAAIRERDAADGRILSSYSGFLPKLSLLGSYTRYEADADNDSYLGSQNQYSAGIQVSQPVYRGGATKIELKTAHLEALCSDEEIRRQAETALYNTASGYYRVLLARQLLTVAEDAVLSAESHLDEVARKKACGAATEYSVLRAQVDVALYQAQAIQQQNQLNMAQLQLIKEMGVCSDRGIELSGTLVYRPMKPDIEQVLQQAVQIRPDLNRKQAELEMSRKAVRLAASRYFPQIRLFANGGWGRPDPYMGTEDEWDTYASLGICIEVPIFDGLKREGRMAESQALMHKHEYEWFEAKEQAILEIRQAVMGLSDAEKFVESQQMNLELATESLRLAEVGYKNGMNSEIDVTDARSAITRARGLHYQAIYNHAISRLNLKKAAGDLAAAESLDGRTLQETEW